MKSARSASAILSAATMFETCLERPSHELLQTNYCTPNSRNNATVCRPLQTIASHELLHELLRQKTTIAATPLAESTPSEASSNLIWERGSGSVQSAGVSHRVRVIERDESPKCSLPEKLFKTRDLELPFFEGSLPSCSPHSAGYTRTFLHPYFPVTN